MKVMLNNSIYLMKQLLISALLSLCSQPLKAQIVPSWPAIQKEAQAGTRWWWMGSAVDETNLSRRIKDYAEAGIGTLEITPIYGVQGNEANDIDFLSPKWMSMLSSTYNIAKSHNVTIEMNMGSGWPFGGSFVPLEDAAHKVEYYSETIEGDNERVIAIDIQHPTIKPQKIMAYPQSGNNGKVLDITSLLEGTIVNWKAPAGKWLIVAVFNVRTGQLVKRAGPGAEGYVIDHFDARIVKKYINYFDSVFVHNNAAYPKTFFCDSYEVFAANWTTNIFEEFYHYRGYLLEEHLDQLFGLGDRTDPDNQVLADYRETLNDMLLNNFTLVWTEWCREHHIQTRYQAHGSPGNLIDLYAQSDIPEMEGYGISDFDIKGLRKEPNQTFKNHATYPIMKFASSAAHLAGRKFVSSETFTWLTDHFRTSLSQMKPDLDLLFTAGINHMYFHGTTYSPDEATWPGWKFYAAIDMSPTNTIWHDTPYLMDYIKRCQSFLQMGKPDNDILIYFPIYDKWHRSDGVYEDRLLTFTVHDMESKLPEFFDFVRKITDDGYSFDYISDKILENSLVADGAICVPGGGKYSTLLIPPCEWIPKKTEEIISRLEKNGVNIIRGKDLSLGANCSKEELKSKYGLSFIRRRNDNGYHYFVSNLTDTDVQGYVNLYVDYQDIVKFNPLTGEISKPSVQGGSVYIGLKSGESMILQTYNEKVADIIADNGEVEELNPIHIDGEWVLSFSESSYPKVEKIYKINQPLNWEVLDENTAQLAGTGIYETEIYLSKDDCDKATAGWLVSLGDVRESARVYINGQYIGCLWSAPFDLVTKSFKEGWNLLRIEVTNLPANRIRQVERSGYNWRIFKDVNIYTVSEAFSVYGDWTLTPSGLNSEVKIIPLKYKDASTTLPAVIIENRDNSSIYRLDGIKVHSNNRQGVIINTNRKILKKY